MHFIHRDFPRRLAAMGLILALCAMLLPAWGGALAEADGMIRVKLTRLGSPSSLSMTADCDYALSGDGSVRIPAGTAIQVTAAGGHLTLSAGGHTADVGSKALLLRCEGGQTGLQFTTPALSNRFCGDLLLGASDNAISAVLNIYIEDYLYGVVGYEMAPSSGLEALKAQAVAARTHILTQKAARGASAYDITDTAAEQVFKGYSAEASYANVIRAVDATRGQVLYYDGALATCYTTASNGGQTESAANALGQALPYSEVKDDPYDLESAGARKTATIRKDGEDLNADLRAALLSAAAAQLRQSGMDGAITDMRLNAIEGVSASNSRFAAPSRLYKSLTFRISATAEAQGESRTGVITVSVPTYGAFETWYDLSINADDNETVWVTETERAFEVTFRRSGTGVGLSQRGAQVMASSYGISCAQILSYYYPGTALRQLTLTQSSYSAAESAAVSTTPTAIATARLSEQTALRLEASDTASPIANLPTGATVTVYAAQGDWAAVGSGDMLGFVRADALAAPALAGTAITSLPENTFVRVNALSVTVRQLPSGDSRALTSVQSGAPVRLYAHTDKWAMVDTQEEITGFVPVDALDLSTLSISDVPEGGAIVEAKGNIYGQIVETAALYAEYSDTSRTLEVLQKGTYVQVMAYNQVWAWVRTAQGVEGFVKIASLTTLGAQATATPAPEAPAPEIDGGAVTKLAKARAAQVKDATARLYSACDEASSTLATLKAGDTVEIAAYNAKWAYARFNGKVGYVLLSALTSAVEQPAAGGIEGGTVKKVTGRVYATVQTEDAILYESWDMASRMLDALPKDTLVRVGAYNSVWACVQVNDRVGFMRMDDLTPVTAAAQQGQTSDVVYADFDAVVRAGTKLYQSATLGGKSMCSVPGGAVVHVVAYNKKCAYVEYRGQRGYVSLKLLRKR